MGYLLKTLEKQGKFVIRQSCDFVKKPENVKSMPVATFISSWLFYFACSMFNIDGLVQD